MLDWDNMFRRYVWDDTRTPYLFKVGKLNRRQARYEILFCALFLGVLFAIISLAALSSRLPHGSDAIVSIYAFTVACAALLLGVSRHRAAALYCASAPVAALAYFAIYGFHPNIGGGDKILLVILSIGFIVYMRRLVAIVTAYPALGEPTEPEPNRRSRR